MHTKQKRYLGTLLLIVAAAAAGAAGAALIIRAAVGTLELPGVVTAPRPASRVDFNKLASSARGTVSFYRARTGMTGVDAVLLPADRIGNGIVLTADGWLMTAQGVLAGREPIVAVFADRTSLPVDTQKAVRDDATGLVFVRVDSVRLTVAPLGDDTELRPGEDVFASDPAAVRTAAVSSVRALPTDSRADLIESTETLARRLLIDPGSAPAGTAIMNASGEAVALMVKDGQAVPLPYITVVLKQLFRDGRIARARSGIRYFSTDLAAYGAASGLPKTGALVTGGKARALIMGGAAEAAGVREGDVIVAVERDRVDANATLSELINEYEPGATVELTLTRAGTELKLPITLK